MKLMRDWVNPDQNALYNPRIRCRECKAVDSMTVFYGKTYPCRFHENTKTKCSGERKMKCEFCGCKYSEDY